MVKSILASFLLLGMTMLSTIVCPILAEAQSTWIQLAAEGKDRKAAADLVEFNGTLSTKTDPAFKKLLSITAAALDQKMSIAPDDAKITLFRGISIDTDRESLSDFNYGTNRMPFFTARLFRGGERNTKLKTTGLRKMSEIGVFEASSQHAQNSYSLPNSPFISTSFSFGVAAASEVVLVLRVAPQRVLVAASTRGEYEVQLPFFIHPSEIVGVLEKTETEKAGARELSEYKLTKVYNALDGMSEKEARKQIQDWKRENDQTLKPLGNRNDFEILFNELVEKKMKNPDVKTLVEDSPTQAETEAMAQDMTLLRSNFRKALKGHQGEIDRNWGAKFIKDLIPYGKKDIRIQEFLVDLANDQKYDSLPYEWSDAALEALREIYKGNRAALRVLRRTEATIPKPPFGLDKSCKLLFTKT